TREDKFASFRVATQFNAGVLKESVSVANAQRVGPRALEPCVLVLSSFLICCANNSQDESAGAAQCKDHPLPPLSPSGALARGGCLQTAAKVCRRNLLGQAAARIR